MANEFVKKMNAEYGIEEKFVEDALYKFLIPKLLPFAILELVRKKSNMMSLQSFYRSISSVIICLKTKRMKSKSEKTS